MAMKKVKVEEAVGMVIPHDLTKILPGKYKGPAFRKGHIIQSADIPYLKDMGKDHIFVLNLEAGQVHEEEAAIRIAQALAGANLMITQPNEGNITLTAAIDGLLKVNREAATAINMVEHVVFSTLHGDRLVKAGTILAGIKVVPLVVDETTVQAVVAIVRNFSSIIETKPLRSTRIGVIVTGNEVYYGRIQDGFAPVLMRKAEIYGVDILDNIVYCPDEQDKITQAILDLKQRGAAVIIISGGMSVDPDDGTPDAIRSSGAEVISYGTPVLPGAMFMLAYLDDTAIMGMPACGMYAQTTVFDLVFPRILAGERLEKKDIAAMGYGGLCAKCNKCDYPHCPFGK